MKHLSNVIILFAFIATIFTTFIHWSSTSSVDSGYKSPTVTSDKRNNSTINISNIKRSVMVKDLQGANKLGVIAMPYLGIYLPIYDKPYDQYALEKGANRLKPVDQNVLTANIWSGNLMLVAHNYTDGTTMFSALQQNTGQVEPYIIDGNVQKNYWLKGRDAYVATEDFVCKYTIEYQKVVSEYDISIRKDTPNPIIQIITCLEPRDDMRIITVGNLTKKYTWDEIPLDVAKYFDNEIYPFNMR